MVTDLHKRGKYFEKRQQNSLKEKRQKRKQNILWPQMPSHGISAVILLHHVKFVMLSHLTSSFVMLSHLASSYLILSHLKSSYAILSYLMSS